MAAHQRPAILIVLAGSLLLTCGLGGGSPQHGSAPDSCDVGRIVDGDTFYCQNGEKVRLIGIDTPEMDQGSSGRRARAALVRLIEGRTVRLENDVDPTDRYRRRLAYVWLRDTLVNEQLVAEGWAVVYTVPPNVRYVERFRQAQRRARTDQRGLWAEGGFSCEPAQHRRAEC
ncbi:MAG: thermonuclease family protein [Gemmatimonadales bacterium]